MFLAATDECAHCCGTIYPDDEKASCGMGLAHIECQEKFEDEIEEQARVAAEEEFRVGENSNRLLNRLEQSLKPKIWQAIKWELAYHWCLALEIVTIERVAGIKRSGHEYFGESTAMRHVYDDVSSCSYSDTYGGNVYLYLGNKRYLMMYVSG